VVFEEADHDSPETSVLMQIPSLGAFVRALLPVSLTGGHTATYGVWVAVHPGDPSARARRLVGARIPRTCDSKVLWSIR
jgi:hypothetical protein